MPPSAWSGAKSWCPPCRTVVEQQYPVVAGRRRAGRHEAPLAATGEIADRLRLAGARRIPGGTNALALDRAEPDPERAAGIAVRHRVIAPPPRGHALEIGRASLRERVGQSVKNSVVAGVLK